jgi:hypothetical protein
MSLSAIVIGNGPSRLNYNLELLKGRAILFGCNALVKDIDFLDFLGICDFEIMLEIQNLSLIKQLPTIITLGRFPTTLDSFKYPKGIPAWGLTGQAMVQVAAYLKLDPIFIIGFGDEGNCYREENRDKAKHFADILLKDLPKNVYRIGDHSKHLKKIPFVEWEDLLNHLPNEIHDKGARIDSLLSALREGLTLDTSDPSIAREN